MDIIERHVGNVVVVDIGGAVDLYNSTALKNHLAGLIDQKHYQVLLNLKRVTYMDSTAIGVLTQTITVLNEHNGELALAEVPESIEQVLRLTKLIRFFKLWPSEAEAVAVMARTAPGA